LGVPGKVVFYQAHPSMLFNLLRNFHVKTLTQRV
jgi:hypothetical protein